jgi:formylglycine-generating enzyme required for sulfatase activity
MPLLYFSRYNGLVAKRILHPGELRPTGYGEITIRKTELDYLKTRCQPLKKIQAIFISLLLLILLAACGGSDGDSSDGSSVSSQPLSTPTQVVLETPTPRQAPPTPTPQPPTPSPPTPTPEQSQGEAEAGAATPTPEAPAPPQGPQVTDVMVEIPAGVFFMGHNQADFEDAPRHEVDLPAFAIDKFEATNIDYAAFVKETGYTTFAEENGFTSWFDEWMPGENDNHPVVRVTWGDAMAYCEWLGKRLPSEAEWEKAARGTDGREYPWGNEWDPEKLNGKDFGLRGTAAVGSFGAGASPYGVEDLAGNVWEWTADWYQAYPGNTANDPDYGERFRVTRGGGWFDVQAQSTTFSRNVADPSKTANDDLGFRCAR